MNLILTTFSLKPTHITTIVTNIFHLTITLTPTVTLTLTFTIWSPTTTPLLGFDEVGDGEGHEGLDQEHVEGDLYQRGLEVCPRPEEGRKEIVVNQVLTTTLIEAAVAEEG